jgi:hypothetical protein
VSRPAPRLVLLAAVLAALVLGVVGPGVTRLIAAVALAIVLPGVAVVYAAALDRRHDAVTTAVFALGAGAAIGILVAMLAALSPWGLGPVTGRVLPTLVTLGALAASVWTRPAPTRAERRSGAIVGASEVRVPAASHWVVPAGVIAVATVAVLSAVVISSSGASAAGPAISIVPDGDRVVVRVDPGGVGGRYQVELTSGEASRTFEFTLAAGQQWIQPVVLPGSDEQVRALLKPMDPGGPTLTVWLDPGAAPLPSRRPAAPTASPPAGGSG